MISIASISFQSLLFFPSRRQFLIPFFLRLSINISDLIKDNKYENIIELDVKRQNIIKSINIEHAKNYKNELIGLFDNNNKQIKSIEDDILQLKKKSKKPPSVLAIVLMKNNSFLQILG